MKKELWEISDSERQHMNPLYLQEMERKMKSKKLLSCCIAINETVAFRYDRDPHSANRLHKINSCTKSILSALVGIAVEQGIIPGLHTPISRYFPVLDKDKDHRKREITIDHLLTMTAGFKWEEYRKRVSYPAMIRSKDWVQYTLKQPLIANPGESMVYNSGCSHLLAAILRQTSGMNVSDYARTHLFAPLGFGEYYWEEDPQGMSIGGFGLHLSIRDMVKFGLLYANNGQWKGKRLIGEDWVKRTTAPLHLTYEQVGYYGRHWWASSFRAGDGQETREERYFFALGYGGQYIIVVPSRHMVVAIASDNFKRSSRPVDYFREYIVPSLQH
ncbi:hypothetical protein PAE9249_01762 [Paenibacillus sp. CECT 9249]|uniref:serine hydrolase domain-containing protein n=1 Tax=Paenibacillus sp. CECT 9249 TaxID=2845385 RepID=UPI001E45963D|nr:serine hydrolase [Paenibacillus sp. CECT 9249]CAH0119263.1 hypothetical protein PAE9249_01762 [Paenibacillus sp. CECT 9249]